MATKLKDLEVTKVDFVDVGANPGAYVQLYKHKDGKPDEPADDKGSLLKRFITAVGKALSFDEKDTDSLIEDFEKSFDQEEQPDHQAGTIEKQAEAEDLAKSNEPKGETEIMVNRDLMTPSERAFYDDIVKRCSQTQDSAAEQPAGDPVEKGADSSEEDKNTDAEKCDTKKSASAEILEKAAGELKLPDDPYAGLHPQVAAELQMLRKRADEAEERELFEIAKKYEVIGKKAEELVPQFKSLKAAGGSAYTDMIGILDAAVDAVSKSAMFTEIGKSGFADAGNGEAWSKIEKKADELQAADPSLTRYAAIDKACMQNPTLVNEYEQNM